MTIQIEDKILYKRQSYSMLCEPFIQYKSKANIDLRLKLIKTSVAKGYQSTWKIVSNNLYLTEISGYGVIKNQDKYRSAKLELRKQLKEGIITPQENGKLLKSLEKECFEPINLSLESLFSTNEKVLAKWYSGDLRVGVGKIIQRINFDGHPKFEEEIIFEIKEGKVIGLKNIKNNKLPSLKFKTFNESLKKPKKT